MANDNEKYLKEFIDFTSGNFDSTSFNDALLLTDNVSVRFTVELNNSMINNETPCYIQFNNKIAEHINLPTLANNYTFGLFLKAPKPNYYSDPYNVALLANTKDTFKLLTTILNKHHFISYGYHNLSNDPKIHKAKELGFNVRACTFDGETTMEKISFNSFIEHKRAPETILRTLPPESENEL